MTGMCLQLASRTVVYKTKLQPTVAILSTELEYMGAVDCGKLLVFVMSVMWDLRVPHAAASMPHKDNDAATAM